MNQQKQKKMTKHINPQIIHIGEWLFANIDGKAVPVKVTAIHEKNVTAMNPVTNVCDSFNYDWLTAIPLCFEFLEFFNTSKVKGMSLHRANGNGRYFVRYINKHNVLKKSFDVLTIHEFQQFYYKQRGEVMDLVWKSGTQENQMPGYFDIVCAANSDGQKKHYYLPVDSPSRFDFVTDAQC